jgi:hypothetical protein
MSKFVIFFLLLSPAAFARNVVLQKYSVSGYVMPEDSFVKNCKIFQNGHMQSETVNGDGTSIGTSRVIPSTQIHFIRILNRLAKGGSISETINPCDIGTTIVEGFYRGSMVLLESSLDCGSKKLNQSAAANVLRSMAKEICGF